MKSFDFKSLSGVVGNIGYLEHELWGIVKQSWVVDPLSGFLTEEQEIRDVRWKREGKRAAPETDFACLGLNWTRKGKER